MNTLHEKAKKALQPLISDGNNGPWSVKTGEDIKKTGSTCLGFEQKNRQEKPIFISVYETLSMK